MTPSIHDRAVRLAGEYRKSEVALISILQEAEQHQIYIKRGHSSLFKYITTELLLSENTAYTLITIARKCLEVSELKEQLSAGKISTSNARRVSAVINSTNKAEWLVKAATLSNRQLEKEIIKVRPHLAVSERAIYVAPERIKLEIGLYESDMLRLRHVQDLLSQKNQRPVSLEETINTLTKEYAKKNDPVEKAKRHKVKKAQPVQPSKPVRKLVTPNERQPLAAHLKHQVNLRDQRRCAQILANGTRCNQSRWLEIHHKIPVAKGGTNTIDNLITLCSSHHRFRHINKSDDEESIPHQKLAG